MKNKRCLILRDSIVLLIMIMICIRIVYVNTHVRMPEVHSVTQGEPLEYRGNEYRIQKVNLWKYTDYYETNSNMEQYMDADEMEKCRVIEVEFQIDLKEEDNVFDPNISIQCAYDCQGIDPFWFSELNPGLVNGDFHSGDVVVLSYVIYQENLTRQQWQQVVDGKMPYTLIFSSYPIKNQMQITDVEKVGLDAEE